MGWLTRWPELRDVVITLIGAVILLAELAVWVVTGRPPDYVLTGAALSALGLTGVLAARRIISTGPSSSSPPPGSPLPLPSSPSLPEAPDGG